MRKKTSPSRLLDMFPGRPKNVFKTWLAHRPHGWWEGVEVVAMDGLTEFKTAASQELPDAATAMDPFHVVRLAGDTLDEGRRRIQRDSFGRRGRKDDPLYKARRNPRTGTSLGKLVMQSVISSLTSSVPAVLVELRRLGRTMKQTAADVLAFFDRPGASNGITEAINGGLEHLRGSDLGLRNLTNYTSRSLLKISELPLP